MECLSQAVAARYDQLSSLVQVEMLHEDRATPSGRGEEFRADAPLSSSKLGEARPEVCLLVYAGPCM